MRPTCCDSSHIGGADAGLRKHILFREPLVNHSYCCWLYDVIRCRLLLWLRTLKKLGFSLTENSPLDSSPPVRTSSAQVTMMNMLVGVLVEVIKTVSEIEREQNLGLGIDRKTTFRRQQGRHDDQSTCVLTTSSGRITQKQVFFGME